MAITQAVNAFGLRLFNSVFARRRPRDTPSVCVSPVGVYTALAISLDVAEGETVSEIQRVLGYAENDGASIRSQVLQIHSSLKREDDIVLDVATRLFYDCSLPLADTVGQETMMFAEACDFRRDPFSAAARVNEWVSAHTHGKIRDMAKPDTNTVITLANAVYFLARWWTPFLESDTRDLPFVGASGKEYLVPTMKCCSYMRFLPDCDALGGATLIEMPYKGGAAGMLIILPPADAHVDEYRLPEEPQVIGDAMRQMKFVRVLVTLPRFRLDPSEPINLVPALAQDMGVRSLFGPEADLRRLFASKDAFVHTLAHKTVVDVNETGTEAAAATCLCMCDGMEPPCEATVNVNRSFLFAIRNANPNLLLFVGAVREL